MATIIVSLLGIGFFGSIFMEARRRGEKKSYQIGSLIFVAIGIFIVVDSIQGGAFANAEPVSYRGTLDDQVPLYITVDGDTLYTSIDGEYYMVLDETDREKLDVEGGDATMVTYALNLDKTNQLKKGSQFPSNYKWYARILFVPDGEGGENIMVIESDDPTFDLNSKMAIGNARRLRNALEIPE